MSSHRPMRWSSLDHHDPPTDSPPPTPRVDLDAAWIGWQQAANKSEFMTSLDLPTAQALVERLLRERPIGARTKHTRPREETP